MGLQLTVNIEAEFVPSNEEWEATVTPIAWQFFVNFAMCDNCERTWHKRELNPVRDLDERIDGPDAPMPMGECPHPQCGSLCYQKEAISRELEVTHYCAGSLPEVNSALETVVWQYQRQIESLDGQVRQAEAELVENIEKNTLGPHEWQRGNQPLHVVDRLTREEGDDIGRDEEI